MADPSPFTPGATVTLAMTGTSANVAVPTGSGTRMLLQNYYTNLIFFKTGTSNAVTATTSDTPLVPNAVKVFTLDPAATFIAGIVGQGGSAGTLFITRGEGN